MLYRGFQRIYALIIGIDQYLNLRPLTGAVNDAKSVEGFLKLDLKVPNDRIRVLHNQHASRAAIIHELRQLASEPKIIGGDPILVYFAGHGALLTPPANWEAGGPARQIQGLSPCDYATDRVPPIPDRTLGCLINHICTRKGNNIVSIRFAYV